MLHPGEDMHTNGNDYNKIKLNDSRRYIYPVIDSNMPFVNSMKAKMSQGGS